MNSNCFENVAIIILSRFCICRQINLRSKQDPLVLVLLIQANGRFRHSCLYNHTIHGGSGGAAVVARRPPPTGDQPASQQRATLRAHSFCYDSAPEGSTMCTCHNRPLQVVVRRATSSSSQPTTPISQGGGRGRPSTPWRGRGGRRTATAEARNSAQQSSTSTSSSTSSSSSTFLLRATTQQSRRRMIILTFITNYFRAT